MPYWITRCSLEKKKIVISLMTENQKKWFRGYVTSLNNNSLNSNYSKHICDLTRNHFTYLWFEKYHFTHLKFALLKFHNTPLLKIRINGNCTLPTYDLARFNSFHPWFKSYHLTHLRWPPLNPRYSFLPFSLENLIYYISQN